MATKKAASKRSRTNRTLSLLVSIMLVVSLVGTPAFAENTASKESKSEATQNAVISEENNQVDNPTEALNQASEEDPLQEKSVEVSGEEVVGENITSDEGISRSEEDAVEEIVFTYQADNAFLVVSGQIVAGDEFKASPNRDLTFEVKAASGFEIVEVKAFAEKRGGTEIPFAAISEGNFTLASNTLAGASSVFIVVKTEPLIEEVEETANKDGKESSPETPRTQPLTLFTEIPFTEGGLLDTLTHSVVFKVGDEEVESRNIVSETLVKPPADPENPNANRDPFHAWYEEGSDVPFDFSQPVSKDVVLNAVFSDNHVVSFTDYSGNTLAMLSAKDNSHLDDYTTPVPALPHGMQFEGWSTEKQGASFTDPITEDIKLYPLVSEVAVAIFITNGPAVSSQTGALASFTPSRPNDADMVREGYTFSHWTLDPDSKNKVDEYEFDTLLDEQVTYIYAVWTPAKVGYQINFWNEKADIIGDPGTDLSNYELIYTMPVSKDDAALAGTAGKKLNTSPTEGTINSTLITGEKYVAGGQAVYDYLDYSSFAWTDADEVVLSGFGDTIVNVYTKRIEYTYNFDLQNSHRAIAGTSKVDGLLTTTKGGETKTYSGKDQRYHTITVKYQQNLEGLWPSGMKPIDEKFKAYTFSNWSSFHGNSASKLSKVYIQNDFSPNKNYNNTRGRTTETERVLASHYIVPTYLESRVYYLEISEAEYEQVLESGAIDTAIDSKELSQIENPATNGIVKHTGEKVTRYYKYSHMTSPNGQSTWNPKGWPGGSIDGFKPVRAVAADMDNYEVAKTKAQMDKMPAGERLGYIAYYLPRLSYDVNLIVGKGDSAGATISDASGKGYVKTGTGYERTFAFEDNFVIPDADPVKENYKFEGWYLDENYQQPFFNEDGIPAYTTMPGKNVTLYGKVTGDSISANYFDGIGSTAKVATGAYKDGDTLQASDLAGTDFENLNIGDKVPGYGEFRGWFYYPNEALSGVMAPASFGLFISGAPGTTYNFYADFKSSETYTVTFMGLGAGGTHTETLKEYKIPAGSRGSLAGQGVYEEDIAALAGTRAGYSFVGWTTEDNAPFTTATRITQNVVVYAQWDIVSYDIEYVLNDKITSPATSDSENPATYTVEDNVGLKNPVRPGYAFAGWYTDEGLTTKAGDPAIATGATGDKTFYAKWTDAVVYDITYVLNDAITSPATNDAANPATYTIEDTPIAFEDPTRLGYTFDGWYIDAELKNATEGIEQFGIGDRTFYAAWIANDYDYVVYHVEKVDTNEVLAIDEDSATFGQIVKADNFVRTDLEKYTYDSDSGDIAVGLDDNVVYLYYTKVGDPVVPTPNPGSDPSPDSNPEVTISPDEDAETPATDSTAATVTPATPAAPAAATATATAITPSEIFNNVLTQIADSEVPLGSLEGKGVWSLVSLILSIVAIIMALILFVARFLRKKSNDDEDKKEKGSVERNPVIWIIAVLLGILPAIAFLMLDDMSLSMAWINAHTLTVFILFLVFFGMCLAYLLVKKKERFAITYVLNGGKNSTHNPEDYTDEDEIALENPQREDYTFAGWYVDKAMTKQVEKPAIPEGTVGSKTFYAKWATSAAQGEE